MQKNRNSFLSYSHYYDLFYNDKEYNEEASYVTGLLTSFAPEANTILELGSGSGNYTARFSEAGYQVTGIDLSESMVLQSKHKKIKAFTPVLGNISCFDLSKKFDAAVSLFDVMCYLTDTEDILSCLKCVYDHLQEEGYFIFDCWHTAGVYTELPEKRVKYAEDEQVHIKRTATPVIHFDKNVVDVNYEFLITDKRTGMQNNIFEKHSLRHFSTVEIEYFAKASGFQLVRSEEPVTAITPTNKSWKVCHILRRK
jgi:SAM-dependent methyltransferase